MFLLCSDISMSCLCETDRCSDLMWDVFRRAPLWMVHTCEPSWHYMPIVLFSLFSRFISLPRFAILFMARGGHGARATDTQWIFRKCLYHLPLSYSPPTLRPLFTIANNKITYGDHSDWITFTECSNKHHMCRISQFSTKVIYVAWLFRCVQQHFRWGIFPLSSALSLSHTHTRARAFSVPVLYLGFQIICNARIRLTIVCPFPKRCRLTATRL